MATTISETESVPETYPTTSPAVTGNDVAWQRIESYIAHRFTPRAVEWVVDGPGLWHPPLKPATISTVEVWSRAGEWETVELSASPYGGYVLPCSGPYRFTATVGGGSPAPTIPAAVWEAIKRLAAYMSAKPGTPGMSSERIQAGSISVQRSRSESWMASALQNSGAADLLRAYRKV